MKEKILNPRSNNFTAVRLILASSVIFSHCFETISGSVGVDGVSKWTHAPISAFGVDGFFFLSGFLVYPSLIRIKDPATFLIYRFFRIWPGLLVSLILTILLGYSMTNASGFAYLLGDTSKFFITNMTLLWKAYYYLTGVRCGLAPCNMNGSLWTLPFEGKFYLILAGLGVSGLANPKWLVRTIYPATIAAVLIWDIPSVHGAISTRVGLKYINLLDSAFRLWPLFALGTAAYVFKDRIRLSWVGLALLAVGYLGAAGSPFELQARGIFVAYGVLYLGLKTAERFPISGLWPDYSYGVYIYAFPVMQAILRFAPPLSVTTLILETILVTLPCACLSWHLIEKPALDWSRRRFRQASRTSSEALSSQET